MAQEMRALSQHGVLNVTEGAETPHTLLLETVPADEVWEPRGYIVDVADGSPDSLRHRLTAVPVGGVGIVITEGRLEYPEPTQDAPARGGGIVTWGSGDVLQWQMWTEGDSVSIRWLVTGRRYVQVP